jgi:hypothetical protein
VSALSERSPRAAATATVTAVALAAVASASAWSLAREAWTTGLRTPLAALTDPLDARVERAVHDPELYRALRDATPADARVFFLGDATDAGTHLAFSQTEPLVFPRRFFRVDGLPAGWTPGAIDDPDRVVAVAYGALRELDLPDSFEPVAAGGRFRIWRLVGSRERDAGR